MTTAASITGVKVEYLEFPAVVTPPSSTKSYFLGGAGVRGLDIDGEFVKFTGLGVYLEEKAVESLTLKWKDKTSAELFESLDFYRDIIKGPFEKFIRGTKAHMVMKKKKPFKNSEKLSKINIFHQNTLYY
ncbi:unnamed protein product [Trifolium pratense]|uniref:Uncharacterized protein n=1 Tax=Trifolium pratense TaxID=57577 RepID=A0ACB0IGE7_TRIPR|nr:unnamed protein product [Trifolium pratense]